FSPSLVIRFLLSFPTRRSSDLCYYLCRRAAPDPGSGKTTGQEANEPRPSVPLERQVSAGIADGRVVLSRRSARAALRAVQRDQRDRKSTRLNSSHLGISYAVFC